MDMTGSGTPLWAEMSVGILLVTITICSLLALTATRTSEAAWREAWRSENILRIETERKLLEEQHTHRKTREKYDVLFKSIDDALTTDDEKDK